MKMEKVKVVLNKCYGGFSLNNKAIEMLGVKDYWDVERSDPKLVQIVEELGEEVSDSDLCIEEALIHPDFMWHIYEHDGYERLVYLPKEHLLTNEKHNTKSIIEEIGNNLVKRLINTLPHGSGIDADWVFDVRWEEQKVIAKNSFRCIDGDWADFTLVIYFNGTFNLTFDDESARRLDRAYRLRDYLEGEFCKVL